MTAPTTTTPYRHVSEEPVHVVCLKCAAVNGAHSLHCPTLLLPQDTPLYEEKP